MSKSNHGIVTPNIKKGVNEIFLVFNDIGDNGAHDIVIDVLLDYLNNRTKLMEKLRKWKMIPKVMDKYDCAAHHTPSYGLG